MTQVVPSLNLFPKLASRVVVLTGGASGIGAALTRLLHSYGSHVFFGDVSVSAGQELESMLSATAASTSEKPIGTAKFVSCNVSKYGNIYELFRIAYDAHGRVDHAISCAGVLERGKYFDDPTLTIDSIEDDAGDTSVLDINLSGSLNFARIASVFLRDSSGPIQSEQRSKDKTFTLLSSIAGIRDSPGQPLYQTSKVAILGLVRGMRHVDLSFSAGNEDRGKIRVNAICPGMTQSAMTEHLTPRFQAAERSAENMGKHGYWQTSEQVAEVTAHLMVEGGIHGKSVYVEAGKGWEFETGLKEHMEVWLGTEPTTMLRSNVEFIQGLGGIRKD